jgi:hypothetical protein
MGFSILAVIVAIGLTGPAVQRAVARVDQLRWMS